MFIRNKSIKTALWFHDLWNRHYSWVVLAKFKHFYETGELVHYDWDYVDIQTEATIQDILIAWGADRQTENDVLDGKAKFDFSKHKVPTNVPPKDIQYYKERELDYIFKDYYKTHGFEYPF